MVGESRAMNLWIKRDTMLTIKREHGEFDIKKIPDGAIFKEEGTNNTYRVRKSIFGFKYIEFISK